jgi:quercetin dioxygenase-like cupin family protein
MSDAEVGWYRWDDIDDEPLNSKLSRKYVTGKDVMLAQISFKEGCVVPRHFHPNEQLTWVIDGVLRFQVGEGAGEQIDVRAGEVIRIPAGVPHAAEALEDTFEVDIFSPPRQDWIDKTDDYLRDDRS